MLVVLKSVESAPPSIGAECVWLEQRAMHSSGTPDFAFSRRATSSRTWPGTAQLSTVITIANGPSPTRNASAFAKMRCSTPSNSVLRPP